MVINHTNFKILDLYETTFKFERLVQNIEDKSISHGDLDYKGRWKIDKPSFIDESILTSIDIDIISFHESDIDYISDEIVLHRLIEEETSIIEETQFCFIYEDDNSNYHICHDNEKEVFSKYPFENEDFFGIVLIEK